MKLFHNWAPRGFPLLKELSTTWFYEQCRPLNPLHVPVYQNRLSVCSVMTSCAHRASSIARIGHLGVSSGTYSRPPTVKNLASWTKGPSTYAFDNYPIGSHRTIATSPPQVSQHVKEYKDIPGPEGPWQWPLLGTMLNFKPFTKYSVWSLHELLNALIDQYGPIVRFRFAGATVLISDPQDAEVLFQNEGRYPIRPPIDLGDVYCKRNNLAGGFNELQGEDWYALRSPSNKRLLKPGSATHYLEQQNQVATDLVRILENDQLNAEELAETFFKYASESIGVVCFNTRLGFLEPLSRRSVDTERFSKASLNHFRLLMHSVTGESLAHNYFRNKTYRDFEDTCNVMNEITEKYLQTAIAELQMKQKTEGFDPKEPNLLYSFFTDSSLHYSRIKVIMNNLYNGGTDSTAKNLMVLLFNLARNPDKQEKLYKEIQAVLGSDQPLTTEALAKMPYLKACLRESFRLINPTALSALRVLHHDTVIRGFRIPAGVSVAYTTHKTSRDNFVDPEQYIPERWLRGQSQRREEGSHILANIPFGYGARGCLGRWFAEQEIYLATVKVLQRLRVGVHPDSYNTKFGYAIFVEPEEPIKFLFTPREL